MLKRKRKNATTNFKSETKSAESDTTNLDLFCKLVKTEPFTTYLNVPQMWSIIAEYVFVFASNTIKIVGSLESYYSRGLGICAIVRRTPGGFVLVYSDRYNSYNNPFHEIGLVWFDATHGHVETQHMTRPAFRNRDSAFSGFNYVNFSAACANDHQLYMTCNGYLVFIERGSELVDFESPIAYGVENMTFAFNDEYLFENCAIDTQVGIYDLKSKKGNGWFDYKCEKLMEHKVQLVSLRDFVVLVTCNHRGKAKDIFVYNTNGRVGILDIETYNLDMAKWIGLASDNTLIHVNGAPNIDTTRVCAFNLVLSLNKFNMPILTCTLDSKKSIRL